MSTCASTTDTPTSTFHSPLNDSLVLQLGSLTVGPETRFSLTNHTIARNLLSNHVFFIFIFIFIFLKFKWSAVQQNKTMVRIGLHFKLSPDHSLSLARPLQRHWVYYQGLRVPLSLSLRSLCFLILPPAYHINLKISVHFTPTIFSLGALR